MNNTSTVNLKTVWIFLLLAITPFLLTAKSVENEPLQSFNCPPFVDLVLNSSDDIPNSIAAWLTSSNELFINSLPNGNTEYRVSNDYGGTPPTAVCNVGAGGIQVVFTASSNLTETSQSCTANIIIIDDEVVIEECPVTDLIINASNNIDISAWLNRTTDLVQTAATNSAGNDGLGEITVTNDYDGALSNVTCDRIPNGLVVVTFTATDECGNTAQCQGEIVIVASSPPLLDCIGLAGITVDCNADISPSNLGIPFAIMADGPGSPVDFTLTHEDNNANLNNCTGTIIRTWTATTIPCGKTSTCVQTITIVPAIEETTPCQDLQFQSTANKLTISNINAANPIIKVFDANWQTIFNCSGGDCPENLPISNLNAGEVHHTDIQLYDENWNFICEDKQDIEIMGGGEPCDTSVCQGDVVLRTQAEVDAFCGCEVIEGDLTIGNSGSQMSNINNLIPLNSLKKVKGITSIIKTNLTDLIGLNQLSIVNTLGIVQNSLLKSLDGLENLRIINGTLAINLNNNLEELNGLSNLSNIGNQLNIQKNEKLVTINSLVGIKKVTTINLIGNINLVSLDGLENLDSVYGSGFSESYFDILGNSSLTDINALSNLKLVEGNLSIADSPLLEDCCPILHLIDDNTTNGEIIGNLNLLRNASGFCNTEIEIVESCQTPPPLCEDINIITQNNQIIVSGLTAPNEIVKVFDKDYNIVFQCVANCEEEQIKGNFPEGTYVVDLQLYDENWEFICAEQRTVILDNTNPCNTMDCETTPPILSDVPADMTVSCDDSYNDFTNVIATDNCDTDVTIEYEEIRTDGNCGDNYVITRIFTAIDNCGNSSEAQQVIHIQDNTAPVLANVPADETVECDAIPSVPNNITATDNCDENVEIEFSEERRNGNNCRGSYILTRTWTARDNCKNSTQAKQVIVVIDTTSPVLNDVPADLTFNAADGFDTTFPIATDNCDIAVDLTVGDVVNATETEIIRTFTATDDCGNSSTAQQIITIIQDGNNLCKDIIISTTNNEISLSNIDAPNAIVKVFDDRYQIIFECVASCENELVIPVAEGVYHTDIQFYDANWGFICKDRQDVEVVEGEPCDTSVCQGDVLLKTQAEIDAFCGCEVIEGNLIIGALGNNNSVAEITSLSSLSDLTRVNGSVNFNSSTITDLSELSNLSVIGKTLAFANNPNIRNLNGLENLSSIGLQLVSIINPNLADMSALSGLKQIGGGVILSNTPISNISFLNNLQNEELTFLEITSCNNLTSLNGLENIKSITTIATTTLVIAGNEQLVDISAIQNIQKLENGLVIASNPMLENCCAIFHLVDSNLDNGTVEDIIVIQDNGDFCNTIEAILQNCQPEELAFDCSDSVISTIEGGINIVGLNAPIEIVKVFDNNYATAYECFGDCEETINLTDLPAGTYYVNINAYDESWNFVCERTETVQVGGNAEDRGIDFSPADFALFPNPAKTEAFIDLSKLKGEKVELVLFNQFGQEVNKQVIDRVEAQRVILDLSTTQNGLYILKIKTKNRKAVAKKLLVSRLY